MDRWSIRLESEGLERKWGRWKLVQGEARSKEEVQVHNLGDSRFGVHADIEPEGLLELVELDS
jgi:hypothetical protein